MFQRLSLFLFLTGFSRCNRLCFSRCCSWYLTVQSMCHIVLVAASIGNLFNSVFVNSVVFVCANCCIAWCCRLYLSSFSWCFCWRLKLVFRSALQSLCFSWCLSIVSVGVSVDASIVVRSTLQTLIQSSCFHIPVVYHFCISVHVPIVISFDSTVVDSIVVADVTVSSCLMLLSPTSSSFCTK